MTKEKVVRFPMQPIHEDKHGTHRFLANRIVDDLLDKCTENGFIA